MKSRNLGLECRIERKREKNDVERERERWREMIAGAKERGEKMCHQSASNRAGIARTLTPYRWNVSFVHFARSLALSRSLVPAGRVLWPTLAGVFHDRDVNYTSAKDRRGSRRETKRETSRDKRGRDSFAKSVGLSSSSHPRRRRSPLRVRASARSRIPVTAMLRCHSKRDEASESADRRIIHAALRSAPLSRRYRAAVRGLQRDRRRLRGGGCSFRRSSSFSFAKR